MKIYEDFHSNTTVQTKVINKSNFTYRILFSVFSKYIIKSQKVLDIGCGAGTVSLYCASKSMNVVGIDISKKGIAEAKKSAKALNLKNVNFIIGEFPEAVPGKDYNLILCFEVLEHLKNDRNAIRKINSLLSKNGIVVASVPSLNAPLHKIGYAKEFDKRVGHLRRYTYSDLEKLFTENKFKIIEYRLHEGIFRNFLFLNPFAGKFIKVINRFKLGELVTIVDSLLVKLFGESDIIIVAKKVSLGFIFYYYVLFNNEFAVTI